MTSLAVVIPLFDKRAFIGESIASLAGQEIPPDVLIIVDDASTDGSAEAAEQALSLHAAALGGTRVELVRRSTNGGPGAARNSGIERADCELLLCLDADDMLRPDALRRMRGAMDRHALAMAVVGFASEPAGEVFPELELFADELRPIEDELFLLVDPPRAVAHPEFMMGRASNVIVRRRWLGAHRYAGARLNEGVDLWYRVLKDVVAADARVGLIAAPLIHFRVVPDSLSRRRRDDWRTLEIPPTVLRYRDSADPCDHRMAAMLLARWHDYALATIPEEQRPLFLAHYRNLFEAAVS
ncbi:glycosyltransferase involved in cell wall biosynthesis [Sphingomonas kyeonggiensis]|uniref:Glycosyltransferase involved in cell wall biosynthesis n=1 Tax=Sphingomonas kyeonggiensis TaxID=1268553 RepID=A0A7W7K455_9SPHN|nr:glycosyltransferase family 2 protein [Sphingomonas kyeonggiensis]MBB4840372.1 glycosyltransferase involved in cell wall biosynthesis [Sphingomonas kyeonggiensis]